MANPYYVKSLGGLSAGNAIGGAIDAYQKRKEKEELQGLMGAAAQGDKSAINQLYGINPQAAQAFENRGYAQEDRILAQNEREQLALKEQEKQRQANTVKFVERLHSLPEEQQESEMAKAVADDNFDFDEDDMLLAKSPQHRKLFLSKNLDKQAFESLFSGDTSDKMTDYQQAMIKGQDADREIRRFEAENKKIDNQLKRETNQVKLEELRNKKIANEEKQFQIKKGRSDAAQTIVDSGKSTLELISEIENHPGFESAIGAKGASSLYGLLDDPVSGSDAAGVVALIETLEAQNFLTAIGEFKSAGGAGSLSDNEGKKLGAALSNLKRSQSEADFKKSLNVIKNLVKKQVTKASPQIEKRFSLEPTGGVQVSTTLSDADLLKKYGG